jgi:hypothetical protein
MPVLDGPSAARVIRDSGCNTYIVGITGNSYRKMLRFFGRVAPMLSFPNPCDTSI